jgi:cytidine deaminase
MSKNADPALSDAIKAARLVRRRAHAPYSGFRVGAAIISTKGGLFIGANVENAAYPEGICAEGAAIAAMVAAGHKRIDKIIVAADPAVTPCGGCRQKIAEFSRPDTSIISVGPTGRAQTKTTICALLPAAFNLEK